MKIVTYILCHDELEEVRALTKAEYDLNPSALDDYDEYVWQEQTCKDAAIERHDEAMDKWRDAGEPTEGTF